MAKSVHPDEIDGGLNVTATATVMHACAGEPISHADVTTKSLADVAMAAGDFTLAAGDTSGRKVTVAAKSAVPVDVSGTADHIALIDATRKLSVTTCTAQALTAGNTVNFPAWDREINAAT